MSTVAQSPDQAAEDGCACFSTNKFLVKLKCVACVRWMLLLVRFLDAWGWRGLGP